MRLPKFSYLRPRTVEEACALLEEHKEEAKVLAGGTALLIDMERRLFTPKYVISLKGLSGLDYIEYDGLKGLTIGAAVTIEDLSQSPLIGEKYPILVRAAEEIGVPAVRGEGTVGGNLSLDTRCIYYNQSHFWRQVRGPCFKTGGDTCHVVKGGKRCYAVYQGDLAPALIALEAKAKLVRKDGVRVVPLNEFFTGRGENPNILKPDELLTEIQIPPPVANSRGAYHKFRVREAIDFPFAGVAAVLAVDKAKVCYKARLVLGAVASAPLEVSEAEQMLQGKKVDDALIEAAAEEAYKKAHPVNNLSLDANYRRKIIRVLFQRAVKQALG